MPCRQSCEHNGKVLTSVHIHLMLLVLLDAGVNLGLHLQSVGHIIRLLYLEVRRVVKAYQKVTHCLL